MSKLGDVLFADVDPSRYPLKANPSTDVQMAVRITLAAFLARQLFRVPNGNGGSTSFNLSDVLHKFPTNKELAYPSASITVATAEVHPHTPLPLESTRDRYAPASVLWRTGELVAMLQVDFFVNDEPTQEAIAAALPAAFNPREDAAGVMLRGPETYWCLPVRCTLVDDPQRVGDTGEAVFRGERRLLAQVRAELDVVHLREAADLLRPVVRVDVRDPGAS